MSASCPCASGKAYAACCAPLLAGAELAPTALSLMRSRYSAYTLADSDYLLQTWHELTRPAQLTFDPAQRWLGLSIRSTENGGGADPDGVVEFIARYKIAGKAYRLHERSRFTRARGAWVYLDGEQL